MPNYNYNTSHWSSFDVKLRSNYKFAGFEENSSLYELCTFVVEAYLWLFKT